MGRRKQRYVKKAYRRKKRKVSNPSVSNYVGAVGRSTSGNGYFTITTGGTNFTVSDPSPLWGVTDGTIPLTFDRPDQGTWTSPGITIQPREETSMFQSITSPKLTPSGHAETDPETKKAIEKIAADVISLKVSAATENLRKELAAEDEVALKPGTRVWSLSTGAGPYALLAESKHDIPIGPSKPAEKTMAVKGWVARDQKGRDHLLPTGDIVAFKPEFEPSWWQRLLAKPDLKQIEGKINLTTACIAMSGLTTLAFIVSNVVAILAR